MILNASHINRSYGDADIIKDATFFINERDKVAVVGSNGAGKTTLLDMLTGTNKPDSGTVSVAGNASIGYLRQINDIDSDDTVLSEMEKIIAPVKAMEAKLLRMQEEMKSVEGEELESLYDSYNKLTHEYEMADGYSAQSRVIGILKGLGFTEEEFAKPVRALSGGEKTRLFLGKLLISHPDIIFLDEPTNHLDLSSIEWLETFLMNYSGTVVIVSHDRYFLDRIVNKVIDVDRGNVSVYDGNYTEFAAKKAAKQDAAMKAYMKQQDKIRHEEAVIEKLQSFNREKSIKRAESRKKLLDKMDRLEKPTEKKTDMNLSFAKDYDSGKDVLEVENLGKTFSDGVTLFKNISFSLKRGEHVAIIGDNGSGKTTILKMLTGGSEPTEGSITFGTGVTIAYYDQEMQVLDDSKTLFDEVQDTYPNMDNTEVRNLLAAFLFTGDDVFKRVGDLSGGERGRVSLAKLMLSKANVIILDEPTNHLDMMSKEILETAINEFDGTVLYVSHDRYFINRTATRILNLKHEKLLNYIGNYDYYLEKKDAVEAYGGISGDGKDGGEIRFKGSEFTDRTSGSVAENKPATTGKTVATGAAGWKEAKAAAAEKQKHDKALAKCEALIAELEEKIAGIDAQFLIPEVQTNSAKLNELAGEKSALEEQLSAEYERWESLCEE